MDGYTQQASDDRNAQDQSVTDGAEQRLVHGIEQDRQPSRSCIDYIGLSMDIDATDIVGAWLGPWGDDLAIASDHRPLATIIRLQGLLGSVDNVPKRAAEQLEPDFPPRHWFYSNDYDRQQALIDIEAGMLPWKLPREAYENACSTKSVQYKLQQLANRREQASSKGDLDGVWRQTLAVGRAIKEELRAQRRDRVLVGKQDLRIDGKTKAYSRVLGLQYWTRKVRRRGEKIFRGPSRDSIPDEILDLWDEAAILVSTVRDSDPDTTSEETLAAWMHVKASVQEKRATIPQATAPKAQTGIEWLLILLRIRVSRAVTGIKKAQAGAKESRQMMKRLQVAEAAELGKTGGIYEPIKPYTKPIQVDVALCQQEDGTTVWRTDDESKRQSARDHCFATTELTEERRNRGTRLSRSDRTSGLIDEQL